MCTEIMSDRNNSRLYRCQLGKLLCSPHSQTLHLNSLSKERRFEIIYMSDFKAKQADNV